MLAYLTRRLLLVIPTLLGILLINFVVIQALPGGPVQRVISELSGRGVGATARITGGGNEAVGGGGGEQGGGTNSRYRGAQGLDPAFIADLERQFGFDKPAWQRFVLMLGNYLRFDFGDSFFRDRSVFDLVVDKMPVSISLGVWTTLLTYLISIPLGIRKAMRDGTPFDVWTSGAIVIGYAIPSFLFAVLLIVLFAGGSYWQVFPLRGLVSENFWSLPWYAQGPGLPLAHGPADRRHADRLVRHADHADQEQLHRGDQQAVCADRPRQGAGRECGPLPPRLPQRDADRDRGLPGGVRLGAVHGLAC